MKSRYFGVRNPIFKTPGVKNRTRGDFLKIGRPAGDAEGDVSQSLVREPVIQIAVTYLDATHGAYVVVVAAAENESFDKAENCKAGARVLVKHSHLRHGGV